MLASLLYIQKKAEFGETWRMRQAVTFPKARGHLGLPRWTCMAVGIVQHGFQPSDKTALFSQLAEMARNLEGCHSDIILLTLFSSTKYFFRCRCLCTQESFCHLSIKVETTWGSEFWLQQLGIQHLLDQRWNCFVRGLPELETTQMSFKKTWMDKQTGPSIRVTEYCSV